MIRSLFGWSYTDCHLFIRYCIYLVALAIFLFVIDINSHSDPVGQSRMCVYKGQFLHLYVVCLALPEGLLFLTRLLLTINLFHSRD